MEAILRQGLAALGLPQDAVPQLMQFSDRLLETNKVMNLTAITEPEEVARLHFLDSAALLTLADFRGMPLRLLEPSLRLTLLDSLGKRITFLQGCCDALGLTDVRCVHARAEEFSVAQRENYDIAVSRAVANLRLLSELCLPLVKVGGQFLAMKSAGSDAEIDEAGKAIALLGGKLAAVRDYPIPGTEVTHRLVVIEKVSPTPKRYPRPFAKIKKAPL